jgi:hypothetical protein
MYPILCQDCNITEKPPTRPKKQPPQGKIIIMMIYLTKSTTKNTN